MKLRLLVPIVAGLLLIAAPARVLQAAAPLLFAWAVTAWGVHALWLTAGLGVASFVALLALRAPG